MRGELSYARVHVFRDETVRFESSLGRVSGKAFVEPSLIRKGASTYVAYYGPTGQMTWASRADDGRWDVSPVDSVLRSDSHNYVELGATPDGLVHLAGNMHATALNYYQFEQSAGVWSGTKVEIMADADHESAVTYPRFFQGPEDYHFAFRDGQSGSGALWFYRYDPSGSGWTSVTGTVPLIWSAKTSAYLDKDRPVIGADGRYHMCWLWRDSPDATDCHSILYARSDDGAVWYNSAGRRLAAPIGADSGARIVDVPRRTGLLNNNLRLVVAEGWRSVLFQRRDDRGSIQIYCATNTDKRPGWLVERVTDWQFEWEFGGLGSLDFKLTIGAARINGAHASVPVRREHQIFDVTLVEGRVVGFSARPSAVSARDGLDACRTRLLEDGTPFRTWLKRSSNDDSAALVWSGPAPNRDRPSMSIADDALGRLELVALEGGDVGASDD